MLTVNYGVIGYPSLVLYRYIHDKGLVAVIAPNVEHGGRALTDCRIIDAFSPVRDDYR